MQLSTRKVLDRSFTALGALAVVLMVGSLLVLIVPIAIRGSGAFVFRETVEHRRFLLDTFGRGDRSKIEAEVVATAQAREPLYQMLAGFRRQLLLIEDDGLLALPVRARVEAKLRASMTEKLPAGSSLDEAAVAGKLPTEIRKFLKSQGEGLSERLVKLFGPPPTQKGQAALPRDRYGDTRWDRAEVTLQGILLEEMWDYSDPTRLAEATYQPRIDIFRGTALEPLFGHLEQHAEEMLAPRWTFYWGFLTDPPVDSNLFGGIWPAVVGTFYLALGAMIFAVPAGVITAIYLVEYARSGSRLVSVLRIFISTLAGVPSIVFGLFGLAFFINQLHVSASRSVLAGSLTLATLVLPTVIRASEEALRAVPHAYKEAALSLGASRWRTILTVILPAAMPGVLTGVILSLGRAAGETAPIIFTAAVSVGAVVGLGDVLSEPTQALPWSIYNVATENRWADEIRHVQYGMVLVLLALVLLLNAAAIMLRARISRKLRG